MSAAVEMVRFARDPTPSGDTRASGSALFIVGDDDRMVRWALGANGFGAWDAGSGLGIAPEDPVWGETKAKACAEAGREPDDVADIATRSGACPYTDIAGLVHVPHTFATVRPGEESDEGHGSPGFDAFVAYADQRGWTLPRWDQLHERERAAWGEIAEAVRRSTLLESARVIAHASLGDDAGRRAERIALACAPDHTTRCVALLHPVIEAGRLEREAIEGLFTAEVADAADALQRRAGEPYERYIERVVAAGDPARAIKRATTKDLLRGPPPASGASRTRAQWTLRQLR